MGLATVVSCAPFPVVARLINRQPGFVDVKPALTGPQMIVLRDGLSRYYVPEEFTPLDKTSHIYIPTMGEALAEEVVWSNVVSVPHYEPGSTGENGAAPAIFWVPGAMFQPASKEAQASLVWQGTDAEVKGGVAQLEKTHPGVLKEYQGRQNNWFGKLVKDADDKWQKYRMNIVISDIERYAARHLGIKRDWMVKLEAAELVACPYCTTLISPLAIICPNCREVLNAAEYEARKMLAKAVEKKSA